MVDFTVRLSLLLTAANAFAGLQQIPRYRYSQQHQAQQRVVSAGQLKMSSTAAAVVDCPPPMAPLTLWGDKISDIRRLQEEMRKQPLPEFALELSARSLGLAESDVDAQLQYFQENAMELKLKMEEHGAVIFRDFELMKTPEGFQKFYKAVGMKPCLDPLHSVSARPTVDGSKNSPVYEAVNKESRKNFFIGTYLLRVVLGQVISVSWEVYYNALAVSVQT